MHDVIIVGAGIAGTVLADNLLMSGLDVLVIEKTEKLKRDSGIVSYRHVGKSIPKTLVDHKINDLLLVSPSGLNMQLKTKKSFSCILKRKKLNRYLISKVKSHVVYDTVKEITWEDGFVQVVAENKRYYAKMVVGCDGACSVVRKEMYKHEGTALNDRHVLGAMSFDRIKGGFVTVYFNKMFSPDFFSWTIPQTNEYGLMVMERPIEFLKHFGKKLGYELHDIKVYPMTIGAKKCFADRTLLVGESAGQTKPLTGGGIDLAIAAAEHAAITIVKSFKEERFDKAFLKSYEAACQQDFGQEIEKQMLLRSLYKKLDNNKIDELFSLAKSSLDKIDSIEDYTKLSDIIKKIGKARLFFWFLKNISTFARSRNFNQMQINQDVLE